MKKRLFFLTFVLVIFSLLSCANQTTTVDLSTTTSTTTEAQIYPVVYDDFDRVSTYDTVDISNYGELIFTYDHKMYQYFDYYNSDSFSYEKLLKEITWEDLDLDTIAEEGEEPVAIYDCLHSSTLIETTNHRWFIYIHLANSMTLLLPSDIWLNLSDYVPLETNETIEEVRVIEDFMIIITSSNRFLVLGTSFSTSRYDPTYYTTFTDITSIFNLQVGEEFVPKEELFYGHYQDSAAVVKTTYGQIYILTDLMGYYMQSLESPFPNLYVNINDINDETYTDLLMASGVYILYNSSKIDFWMGGIHYESNVTLYADEKLVDMLDLNVFLTSYGRKIMDGVFFTTFDLGEATSIDVTFIHNYPWVTNKVYMTNTNEYYVYSNLSFTSVTSLFQEKFDLGYEILDYTFVKDSDCLYFSSVTMTFSEEVHDGLVTKYASLTEEEIDHLSLPRLNGFTSNQWDLIESEDGIRMVALQEYDLLTVTLNFYYNGTQQNAYTLYIINNSIVTYDQIVSALKVKNNLFSTIDDDNGQVDEIFIKYHGEVVETVTFTENNDSIDIYLNRSY